MKSVARKANVLVSVYHALMLEYRAEIYLWALSNVLPLIMMGLWVSAAQRADYGLSPGELGSYFVAVFIVRQYTTVWVIWEFEYDLLHGRLSPMLLQPLDPGWRYVALHAGEKIARTPFAALIVAGVLWWYPPARWSPHWTDLACCVVAVAGAFTLRFLMQYAAAMLGFWYERSSSVEGLFFLPYLFLSGLVAPLELFPPLVREVAVWTPFPYLLHLPARVMLGHAEEAAQGLAVMGLWIVLFWCLQRWTWRRGLRRHSSMGA